MPQCRLLTMLAMLTNIQDHSHSECHPLRPIESQRLRNQPREDGPDRMADATVPSRDETSTHGSQEFSILPPPPPNFISSTPPMATLNNRPPGGRDMCHQTAQYYR
ncbi:hypothetical protein EDB80DRAFT_705148, partial [Ilyonectria destructans]